MAVDSNSLKIAYIFVQFPKITETFNLREMLKLQEYGVALEVFSLLTPAKTEVVHPEAQPLTSRTHYSPWLLSLRLWQTNLRFLLTRPTLYLGSLTQVLGRTLTDPLLLVKTIGTFFKSAYFAQLCVERGVEHIHATFAAHNTTAALIISRLTGIAYSFTIDAYDLYVETSLLQLKLERADFVTTISKYNLEVIRQRYGKPLQEKTHCIYRGIDLKRHAPPEQAPELTRPFTLICVASLNIKKGHRFLFEAVAELHGQGRALRCVIAGDGPLRKELMGLAEQLGIANEIEFAGDLTQEQVISRLQQADCCVLPSIIGPGNRMEGIPNALMEALACELPVVSTRISGIPELVEEHRCGLLVKPEDSSELADAIAWLQDHPEQRRLFGKAGREKVRREFNIEVNIEKLWKLYRQSVP